MRTMQNIFCVSFDSSIITEKGSVFFKFFIVFLQICGPRAIFINAVVLLHPEATFFFSFFF